MKQYLVEFLKDGAKIYKDPAIIEAKKAQDNVLLNPTLPKSVNPIFWYKDGSRIGVKRDGKLIKVIDEFEKKNLDDDGSSFEFLKSVVLEESNAQTKRLNNKVNTAIFLFSLVALFLIAKSLL